MVIHLLTFKNKEREKIIQCLLYHKIFYNSYIPTITYFVLKTTIYLIFEDLFSIINVLISSRGSIFFILFYTEEIKLNI